MLALSLYTCSVILSTLHVIAESKRPTSVSKCVFANYSATFTVDVAKKKKKKNNPMSMPGSWCIFAYQREDGWREGGRRENEGEREMDKCRQRDKHKTDKEESQREMHLTIFIWTMTILSLKYTISCMCSPFTCSASLSLRNVACFNVCYVCVIECTCICPFFVLLCQFSFGFSTILLVDFECTHSTLTRLHIISTACIPFK